MNTKEQTLEYGRMVEERKSLHSELACIENKLRRFRTALENAAHLAEFYDAESGTLEADLADFPSKDELVRLILRRDAIDTRVEEINHAINP